MDNVRIAIRDSTDSHNVAFFDNISGIQYQSANLQRFLAGSASILTIEYNSKDIDTIRTGCKLAFIYKERAYWLNIMDLSKKGYKVEITAYSLGLELNQEERGAHKPANAMSFTEYLAYYDPEHALEIGVNEVADKRIKLEWTGTDTILARLFSIANSFGAELEFTVELNQDYSLKRQVLNVYKKGNLGSNRAASPIRVGRGLKVINYSDNLKELRTAVRATGKDGLTIDGLNKKVYDDDGNLLYYSSGMTVYAPQSRDKYPSVGKKSNDNWIIKELGETEYSTKEALWGYMLSELKKICVPEITYDIEGAIDGDVGDTRTLIDDVHYDPPLYVQGRIAELTEDLITGKVTNSTLTNFERKYSQVAGELLKQVEQLANVAAPYIIRLSTDNGFNFKNGKGTSTVTAKLEKNGKNVSANWKWLINNNVVSDKNAVSINGNQVAGTLNVVPVAIVGGKEVAREYITFTNSDDGVGIKTIKRYYTTNDQAEGVTAGGQNWSTKPTTVTSDKNYMWSYDVITYTNDTSLVTEPAVIGARGNDGLDADTTGVTEALDKAKQELTALSANIEKVRDDSLAAVDEAKQKLATVADNLSKAKTDLQNAVGEVANNLSNAKTDLQNAVGEVDRKAADLQGDLTKAKQDLQTQASQLTAQANAQSELTNRVSLVETTANGTKTTVSELSKTVDSNAKNITSVTARTKTVEDDLSGTKTTLSQVKTTADSTSQKAATLETGLNGLSAKFDNLKIGGTNLLLYSADPWQAPSGYYAFFGAVKTDETLNGSVVYKTRSIWNSLRSNFGEHLIDRNSVKVGDEFTYSVYVRTDQGTPIKARLFFRYNGQSNAEDMAGEKLITQEWQRFTKTFTITQKMLSDSSKLSWVGFEQTSNSENGKFVYYACNKLERGNIATDYSPNEADLEQKVSEYKQTADQNYASLQTTVQNLDGTVQQNKTTAEQTAAGFKTRIESLETYKDGETTRANQYFESAKTETARQLTAERTAIAKDYVAKSTYTSDVTGIRNDLTATTATANTIKTNLANYQASNDKAVANLQSNLQEANGNISSLRTKVEAVPGQITSAVSAVEGKIPTSAGGRNLAQGTSKDWSVPFTDFEGIENTSAALYKVITDGLVVGDTIKTRIVLKYTDIKPVSGKTAKIWIQGAGNVTVWNSGAYPSGGGGGRLLSGSGEAVFELTDKINVDHLKNDYWSLAFRTDWIASGSLQWKLAKVERGMFFTDWSPAPEDTATQISSLSSQITQTADGMTLLATKTELNTAKSDLQSGITTATNKADVAQNTANNNAQTISTHTTQISALNTGLSAKVSQSDFNTLSGRVTNAENNITAKANELSSKITSVEGKIPTSVGGTNLLLYSSDPWQAPQTGYYQFFGAAKTSETYNGAVVYKTQGEWNRLGINLNKHLVERGLIKVGDVLTYSVLAKTDQETPIYSRLFVRYDNQSGTENISGKLESIKLTKKWQKVSVTFTVNKKMLSEDHRVNYLGWEQTTRAESGKFVYYTCNKLEKGSIPSDWTPAPEDYDSKLASAQSEIKQTTDAITASVSSVEAKVDNAQTTANSAVSKADVAQAGVNTLDSTTVKTASLNLDNNGFVTKVGKTVNGNTFATMIAQDANNVKIIADKMQVTADMIVNGAITGDKIKANSVDVTKIVGIDADYIKAKIEYAMIDWLKGKTITAYNDNMTIDLQNGRISFKDGSNAVYRQTPDGIHTGFMHFEAGSQGGIYAAFGATSTRQGINSKSSEFAGIRCYRVSANGDSHDAKIDKIEVIGDTVQFGHGYRSDGQIGGGFIMDTAAFGNETPYSLNRVIKSIEALWRILHDHAKNTGYRFNDSAFINALNNEYNAWHDMHND